MARQRPRPFGWVTAGFHRVPGLLKAVYRRVARTCGTAAVTLVVLLLAAISSLYFAVLWPQLSWPVRLAQGLLVLGVLAGILSNFALSVTTVPGSTEHLPEGYHLAAPEGMQFCPTCRKAKPLYTHHCSICNRCVLQHVQHCVFIHNCIGLCNYGHWLRFVMYLLLGCCCAGLISYQYLRQAEGAKQWEAQPFRLAFVSVFVLSFGVGVGMLALVAWHACLLANGWGRPGSGGAKAGSWRACGSTFRVNFQDTLGVSGPFWWLLWLLPAVRQRPLEQDIDCPTSSRIPRLRITSLPF